MQDTQRPTQWQSTYRSSSYSSIYPRRKMLELEEWKCQVERNRLRKLYKAESSLKRGRGKGLSRKLAMWFSLPSLPVPLIFTQLTPYEQGRKSKQQQPEEIQPVHPKGDQSWMFIGRTDAEAPILWPPDAKNWLTGKDPDAGRDWGQEEKGTTKDEMVGWHHRLDGHEFEYTSGVGDGQGGLACWDSWGHRESDTTEWLNWTELKLM